MAHFFNVTGLFHWAAINNLPFVNQNKHPRKYNETNLANPKGLTAIGTRDKNFSLSRAERQHVQSLHRKKFRYIHNQFIIEGVKLFQEATAARFALTQVYIGKSAYNKNLTGDITTLKDTGTVKIISDEELNSISSLKNPEGVIAVAPIPEHKFSITLPSLSPFIYLWEINDPGNLGTILRTARWFGIKNVLLSPNSVDPFSPKVVRGSMGAVFNITVWKNVEFVDLTKYVVRQNIPLLSADTGGTPVKRLAINRWGLIMGNESHGLPDFILKTSKHIIGIHQYGSGESLNVSVSAGIILHELCQKGKG